MAYRRGGSYFGRGQRFLVMFGIWPEAAALALSSCLGLTRTSPQARAFDRRARLSVPVRVAILASSARMTARERSDHGTAGDDYGAEGRARMTARARARMKTTLRRAGGEAAVRA